MKNKNIKLYNAMFPIWILWLFPATWIIILPANFIIDLTVVYITMKYLKIKDIKSNIKTVIFKVWIFGFIADFIGTFCMFMAGNVDYYIGREFNDCWHNSISSPVDLNPFTTLYSFLWVTVCVIISAIFIYIFNYKICLKNTNLDTKQKKKIALSLAIFTTPYLFYLPTELFF